MTIFLLFSFSFSWQGCWLSCLKVSHFPFYLFTVVVVVIISVIKEIHGASTSLCTSVLHLDIATIILSHVIVLMEF
jgi:hypothetical protein